VVEAAIGGSLVAGLYAESGEQAGFARAVTDRATFAWIADAFVLEPHRGRGLGIWLVETLIGHPALAGVRQIVLATDDAHELYRRFGFEAVETDRYLVLRPRGNQLRS
jgi:GNAT superfamily N-acetyltransferase